MSALGGGARVYLLQDPITADYIVYPLMPIFAPMAGLLLFARTGFTTPWMESALCGLTVVAAAKYGPAQHSWPMAAMIGLMGAAAYTIIQRISAPP